MPSVFLYIIKLSLSLAVVYTFYQFVLRRLTFYNWNRFYLIVYTALSFFISFVNITPVLERNEMLDNRAVQFIPSVNTFNSIDPVVQFQSERSVPFSTWDWVLLCIAAGVIIMLVRLFVQLISFKRIINKARLLSDDNVKLYQVDQPVIPFSFGNSIFLNQHQHSESELHEIVRHEFVHIKQKHTVDILWSELLCIFNWYNPFAWLIRKSIRQNLEFIADDKVLQSGIDRRQYQYLLLKVTGNNHFSIASQFNFSSLKKRIAMMNKMKSARVHLVKFLFLLPLVTVILVSFRSRVSDEPVINYFGIVTDGASNVPIKDVTVTNENSGREVTTDERGFFSMEIPAPNKMDVKIKFQKKGYLSTHTLPFKMEAGNNKKSFHIVELATIRKGNQQNICADCAGSVAAFEVAISTDSGYYYAKEVEKMFAAQKGNRLQQGQPEISPTKIGKADKVVINDMDSLILTADAISWSSTEKTLYLKGAAVLKSVLNDMEVNATNIVMNGYPTYVLFNGKELIPDVDYVSSTRSTFLIVKLNAQEAIKKYGDKAKDGAVEILSSN